MKYANEVSEIVLAKPDVSAKEIATELNIEEGYARKIIWRMINRGWMERGTDNGKSVLKVIRIPEKVYDFKKEMLKDMCDAYYEDFMKAELYTERVEIGKMICRILDKL